MNQPLKSQGTRSTASAKHSRLRSALVVFELAASLALLIGAGLMLKSFVRLERVDPGFGADKLLTIWTVLSDTKYPGPQRARFYQQVWERIRSLPGVKSVGAIDDLPLTGIHAGGSFSIEGHSNGIRHQRSRGRSLHRKCELFSDNGHPFATRQTVHGA